MECHTLDVEAFEDAKHTIVTSGGIAGATTRNGPRADAAVRLSGAAALLSHPLFLISSDLFLIPLLSRLPLVHLGFVEVFEAKLRAAAIDPFQVFGSDGIIRKLVARDEALERSTAT